MPILERNGPMETFVDVLRTRPLEFALTVIGIALMLGLMAVPCCYCGNRRRP